MWIADQWKQYRVLDAAAGEKLEDWNGYRLVRPDPQAIWGDRLSPDLWADVHGRYRRSSSGGGSWDFPRRVPDRWPLAFEPLSLTFQIKPMGFKHTGLFPEQSVNWLWLADRIGRARRHVRVLNLFAYTGGATLAAAQAGAEVVHVDASKGMVAWAKENLASSGLADRPVRFFVDDVMKLVQRERRRGRTYDVIVMDPPSYGRGPGGEVWKLEDGLYRLVLDCVQLLSDRPLLFLINSYTTGLQPAVLYNLLSLTVARRFGGSVRADEIALPLGDGALVLPCGASGRWEADDEPKRRG